MNLEKTLSEHRADDVARGCIPIDDGRMAWDRARRCACGWHGPSDQHDAHLVDVIRAALFSSETVERAAEALRRQVHAPMSDHDPRSGECNSCPWPAREVFDDTQLAEAVLAAAIGED